MSSAIKVNRIYTGGTSNKRVTFSDPTITDGAASITARLIVPGNTAVGNELVCSAAAAGADWPAGIVVVPFDDVDTALYQDYLGAGNWLRLIVTQGSEPMIYMTRPTIEILDGHTD